jgi:hypothetical protein
MAIRKPPTLFDKLKAVIAGNNLKQEQELSTKWLKNQLDNFAPYSKKTKPEEILSDKRFKSTSNYVIGQMFMFKYSAKNWMTLPFWDSFPLSIFIDIKPDSILGLNLHYLPMELRAKFFDALLDTLNTRTVVNENSKLILTYDLLKSATKYKYFKPCIKRYLIEHIKSKVIKVPQVDWAKTIFIQSAQWQKAGEATVYKWSRSII